MNNLSYRYFLLLVNWVELNWRNIYEISGKTSWRITNQISEENFRKRKFQESKITKNKREILVHVHFHLHHLSTFRIFPHSKFDRHTEFKSSLFEDELRKLRISTTFKSLWSFLFSLSNVCWKKFWWDKICCFTTFLMMISHSRKFLQG